MTEKSLDEELAADGFDDPDEKTSPEVKAPKPLRFSEEKNPVALIATIEPTIRAAIVDLLAADGWNVLEVQNEADMFEQCRAHGPQLVLLDTQLINQADASVIERLHKQRPDATMRVVALLSSADSDDVAAALADGFDDFVSDPTNAVEVLARASSNLRSARAVGELNKQRRDAALLLELSQTLASSLDMQLILHTVSRLIAEVISLERCSIVLLDPEHDDAVMVAASEDRTVKDLRIKLSNYPELKRCVESGAPVLIDDAMTDPLLSSVSKSVAGRNVRTMALFPIVFEERVTGVLFLRSSKPARRLSDTEIQFGQTVASACAVAIRNARLFDQFRDQTERINSMRMLAERQTDALRKYQDFFEYAADGMAIVNHDGHTLYVNKEGRRLLGRTRDDLLQLAFHDLLLDESRERWNEAVEQVRRGRFKRSFDVFVGRGDGNERVFSLSAGGGGEETGLLIVSFRDVTETREMEGELRTTKEFLENLIDNSVDGIVAADMNGNIMLFNKGAERIYGHRAEDVIGRMHVSQLYPGRVAHEIMRKLRDERWGGRGRLEAQRREIVTVTGDIVPVSMTASVIYEDGEEVATVGVFTDLRERINVERQLNEAKDLLSKSEKARVAAELAGMAAHELNQPLTSVLGYSEMLRGRVPEGDSLRRPIDTIFRQAERMAEIVRKIGHITKYETKRYGLNTDMIDLNRASAYEAGGGDRHTPHQGAPAAPPASGSYDREHTTEVRIADMVTVPPPPRDDVERATPHKSRKVEPPPDAPDPRAAIVRMDTVEESRYVRNLRERTPAIPTPAPPPSALPRTTTSPARFRSPLVDETRRMPASPRPPTAPPTAAPIADAAESPVDEQTNPSSPLANTKTPSARVGVGTKPHS